MAALCRQVCGRRGWPSVAWVGAARRAPPPLPPGRPRALTAAGGAAEPTRPARGPEDVGRGVRERPGAAAAEEEAEEAEARRSLAGMGFTEALAGDLLRIRPGTSPGQRLAVVAELLLLGVRPEPVCRALGRSPRLLTLPVPQLQRRAGYLRKLGLEEGKLRRVLQCCPDVFCEPQRTLERVVSVLRERCLFSAQQVTQVLHRCPHVLREDPQELEYKFQYAYFRMGIKHADVVKTDFLQYPIAKTRQRHVFLERLGRYQTPDKKGQTQVPNPLLKDILRVSEAEFLASTARSSAEEFDVFKKLLAREEEEELASLGCEDGGACPSEEEEEEEEEEGEEEEL